MRTTFRENRLLERTKHLPKVINFAYGFRAANCFDMSAASVVELAQESANKI